MMLRTATSGANSSPTSMRALTKSAHLPAARQRRLDFLLDKGRESSLSAKESAELETMLDEIDRKSFWKVAHAVAISH